MNSWTDIKFSPGLSTDEKCNVLMELVNSLARFASSYSMESAEALNDRWDLFMTEILEHVKESE